jgi:hypothetical protein
VERQASIEHEASKVIRDGGQMPNAGWAPAAANAAPSKIDAAPSKIDAAPSKIDAAPSKIDAAPSKIDAAPIGIRATSFESGAAPANIDAASAGASTTSATPDVAPAKAAAKTNACPVCQEEVNADDDAKLICGHGIHFECARQLRDPRCPLCRAPITTKSCKLPAEDIRAMDRRQKADAQAREAQLTGDALNAIPGIMRGLVLLDHHGRMRVFPLHEGQAERAEEGEETAEEEEPEASAAARRASAAAAPHGCDPPEGSAEYMRAVNEIAGLMLSNPQLEQRELSGLVHDNHPFLSPDCVGRLLTAAREILA